jgi:hypothetical protein
MDISKNRILLMKRGLIVLSIDILAQKFSDKKSKEDAQMEVDEIHLLIDDLEIYELKQFPLNNESNSQDKIFEEMKIKAKNHFS